MTTDFRALCAELVELCTPVDSIPQLAERLQKLNALADRARALLAETEVVWEPMPLPGDAEGLAEVFWAEPEAEGPTDEDLVEALRRLLMWPPRSTEAACEQDYTFARAALARWGRPAAEPVPEPTDEALANFTAWFCRNYPGPDTLIHRPEWHAPKVFRAASDAIARWGRPTPQPVAVSERLPGPEDCDEQGRCWLWERDCGYSGCKWALVDRTWSLSQSDEDLSVYTHWLPANALPTPETTND